MAMARSLSQGAKLTKHDVGAQSGTTVEYARGAQTRKCMLWHQVADYPMNPLEFLGL